MHVFIYADIQVNILLLRFQAYFIFKWLSACVTVRSQRQSISHRSREVCELCKVLMILKNVFRFISLQEFTNKKNPHWSASVKSILTQNKILIEMKLYTISNCGSIFHIAFCKKKKELKGS